MGMMVPRNYAILMAVELSWRELQQAAPDFRSCFFYLIGKLLVGECTEGARLSRVGCDFKCFR
jgi:hypothetical protein